jgi:L-cystine uptake protein TcyP (sodium:dicarboxylate symporter family)
MSDSVLIFRIAVTYALAIVVFWVLSFLNKTHHWLSPRLFLALSIGIGVAMCLGAVTAAAIKHRSGV